MPKRDSAGIDPTYDHPRAILLLALERKHNVTWEQPRPLAMDFELRYESRRIRLSLHESTGQKGFWGLGETSFQYLDQVDRWLFFCSCFELIGT